MPQVSDTTATPASGKHILYKYEVASSHTPLFLQYVPPERVEKVKQWLKEIEHHRRDVYTQVKGRVAPSSAVEAIADEVYLDFVNATKLSPHYANMQAMLDLWQAYPIGRYTSADTVKISSALEVFHPHSNAQTLALLLAKLVRRDTGTRDRTRREALRYFRDPLAKLLAVIKQHTAYLHHAYVIRTIGCPDRPAPLPITISSIMREEDDLPSMHPTTIRDQPQSPTRSEVAESANPDQSVRRPQPHPPLPINVAREGLGFVRAHYQSLEGQQQDVQILSPWCPGRGTPYHPPPEQPRPLTGQNTRSHPVRATSAPLPGPPPQQRSVHTQQLLGPDIDVAKRGKLQFYPQAPDTWPEFAVEFKYQQPGLDLVNMDNEYARPADVHKLRGERFA
jgi:hypothetical protein